MVNRTVTEIDQELALVRRSQREGNRNPESARELMDLLIERAKADGDTDKPLHHQLRKHLEAVIRDDL